MQWGSKGPCKPLGTPLSVLVPAIRVTTPAIARTIRYEMPECYKNDRNDQCSYNRNTKDIDIP